jgi:hypothetical protein
MKIACRNKLGCHISISCGLLQDDRCVSAVTLGMDPPLVFHGEGCTFDEANYYAASAALLPVQVYSVAIILACAVCDVT